MATPFATAADLQALTTEVLSGAALTQAEAQLAQASALIRGYCPALAYPAEAHTVMLDGAAGRLMLPLHPVVSVASVLDQAGDAIQFVLVNSELLLPWAPEFPFATEYLADIRRYSIDSRYIPRFVTVTYTAGYTVVPDDVKAICLDIVIDCRSNPGRYRQEILGDYSVTYANDSGLGGILLGDAHRKALRRYRRTTGSVSLA
jgi:hypothetical protein